LLKQKSGSEWSRIELQPKSALTNPSLGVFDDAVYEQGTVPLAPGDRFCVYTDGVTDCPDSGDRPFGERRLRDLLTRHDDRPLPAAKAAILEELREHAGGALTADDTTLLMVEVTAAA
jgi:sigma-B regulation protein RsbU (phosphoserine phosphatase)